MAKPKSSDTKPTTAKTSQRRIRTAAQLRVDLTDYVSATDGISDSSPISDVFSALSDTIVEDAESKVRN